MRIEANGMTVEGTIEEIREWCELNGIKLGAGEITTTEIEEESLEVGEYVRIIKSNHGNKTGVIAEITGRTTDDSLIVRRIEDDTEWLAERDQLEKVSDEEANEIEKWAKIGRKPNEYKKGDIVRVLKAKHGSVQGHKVGTIGIIDMADGTDRPSVLANGISFWEQVELVAPVESVFSPSKE